jgi:hypothetical protein
MMKTAMHDLMDKNRLGSASTGVGSRSNYEDDGSIIKNEDVRIEMTGLSNGRNRKRKHNPQSEISEKDFKQHSRKAKLMRLDLDGQLNGTSNGIDWEDLDSSTNHLNGQGTIAFDNESEYGNSASKLKENWSDDENDD